MRTQSGSAGLVGGGTASRNEALTMGSGRLLEGNSRTGMSVAILPTRWTVFTGASSRDGWGCLGVLAHGWPKGRGASTAAGGARGSQAAIRARVTLRSVAEIGRAHV